MSSSDFEELQEMRKRLLDAQNNRELLAIHEAGHAAVAEHLNMSVKRVVLRDPNSSFTELEQRPRSKETLLDDLTVVQDGYCAALKQVGEEYIARANCGFDYISISKFFAALSISENEQAQWVTQAEEISQRIVEQEWASIKKLASVLLQNEETEGGEVRRILAEAKQ